VQGYFERSGGLRLSDPEWSIVDLRYFNPASCDALGKLGKDPRAEPTNFMRSLLPVMSGQMPCFRTFETDWDTKDGSAVRDIVHVSGFTRGHVVVLRAVGESWLGVASACAISVPKEGITAKAVVTAIQACPGTFI